MKESANSIEELILNAPKITLLYLAPIFAMHSQIVILVILNLDVDGVITKMEVHAET
jgi:hypothetical protein